jgi:hypothetical protein
LLFALSFEKTFVKTKRDFSATKPVAQSMHVMKAIMKFLTVFQDLSNPTENDFD